MKVVASARCIEYHLVVGFHCIFIFLYVYIFLKSHFRFMFCHNSLIHCLQYNSLGVIFGAGTCVCCCANVTYYAMVFAAVVLLLYWIVLNCLLLLVWSCYWNVYVETEFVTRSTWTTEEQIFYISVHVSVHFHYCWCVALQFILLTFTCAVDLFCDACWRICCLANVLQNMWRGFLNMWKWLIHWKLQTFVPCRCIIAVVLITYAEIIKKSLVLSVMA